MASCIRLLSICFIFSLALLACDKQGSGTATPTTTHPQCQYPCYPQAINIYFGGYTTAEIDTIVYRTFQPDGSFSNLIMDTLLTNPHTIPAYNQTFSFSLPNSYNIMIYPGADYEFYIPSINQTIRISKLVYSHDTLTADCGKPYNCYDKLDSFSFSGANMGWTTADAMVFRK